MKLRVLFFSIAAITPVLANECPQKRDNYITHNEIQLIQTDAKGVSLAMAMASMPSMPNSIGVGFSQFEGNKGSVIGVHKLVDNDKVLLRIIAGQAGDKKAASVGGSWSFK